jgi:hypothetical protein
MKFILFFLIPIFALKPLPKFCIDCKHFIPDRNDDIYGKCSLFLKKNTHINYLVKGVIHNEYYYCSTMRENECGEKGKYYEQKLKNITDNYDLLY